MRMADHLAADTLNPKLPCNRLRLLQKPTSTQQNCLLSYTSNRDQSRCIWGLPVVPKPTPKTSTAKPEPRPRDRFPAAVMLRVAARVPQNAGAFRVSLNFKAGAADQPATCTGVSPWRHGTAPRATREVVEFLWTDGIDLSLQSTTMTKMTAIANFQISMTVLVARVLVPLLVVLLVLPVLVVVIVPTLVLPLEPHHHHSYHHDHWLSQLQLGGRGGIAQSRSWMFQLPGLPHPGSGSALRGRGPRQAHAVPGARLLAQSSRSRPRQI